MTLGEILRQRRLELGLSQSAVAGTQITRNMLSQLEHDQASPSLKTLTYLSDVLQIPIGVLVGEETAEQKDPLAAARACYVQADYLGCLQALPKQPDLSEEGVLLLVRSSVQAAKVHLQRGRISEARTVLRRVVNQKGTYLNESDRLAVCGALLECAAADGEEIEASLRMYLSSEQMNVSGDSRNLLLASAYLKNGQKKKAAEYLQQVDVKNPRSLFLRGVLEFQNGEPENGVLLLERAEQMDTLPRYMLSELYRLLEQFYSVQRNYQLAYHYAVLRMELQ